MCARSIPPRADSQYSIAHPGFTLAVVPSERHLHLKFTSPSAAPRLTSKSSDVQLLGRSRTIVDSENGNIESEEDLDTLLDVNNTIFVEAHTLFATTRRHLLPYVEQCTIDLDAARPAASDAAYTRREFLTGSACSKVQTVPLPTQLVQLINRDRPSLINMFQSVHGTARGHRTE
ncbi:hypothetical protein FOMPIDRAFT_1049024 [Fomitopsis schrenkii]|uniref:Uncharacterized protein n=1 Tax=Fomitopsis schrenkii TaxID=2126942 RepID=S8FT04_FOMSC|nr:hypothetical protein FOMPIDRAFT_1049024 [Fomitopsis schrenkii]